MADFTILTMIMHGWMVLSVLAVGSILSWTIITERLVTISRAKTNSREFIAKLISILEARGTDDAVAFCRKYDRPIARVAAAVLQQSGVREDRQRALEHALQSEIRELQSFVPVLATIGSMSPFVGLLGTVIGIVKAFRDIAANAGGGPEVVSAGVAEALITTAAGLIVAIPAIVGYNYCVHQVQRVAEEIELACYDLVEHLAKR